MSNLAVVGIDPGLKGGIVCMRMRYDLIECWKTPTVSIKKGKGYKYIYDETAMAILAAVFVGPVVFYIEKQQAFPGKSAASNFSTGLGYGIWRGIFAALGTPHVIIPSKTWQGPLHKGLDKKWDAKARTLYAVSRRFPDAPIPVGPISGKPHGGCVDALGIAWYGSIKEGSSEG